LSLFAARVAWRLPARIVARRIFVPRPAVARAAANILGFGIGNIGRHNAGSDKGSGDNRSDKRHE